MKAVLINGNLEFRKAGGFLKKSELKNKKNMNGFELKLGSVTYTCAGNHSSKEDQNWNISAKMNGLRVSIEVPIEEKMTRIKCMVFVEAFHMALSQAIKDQNLGQLQYGHQNI